MRCFRLIFVGKKLEKAGAESKDESSPHFVSKVRELPRSIRRYRYRGGGSSVRPCTPRACIGFCTHDSVGSVACTRPLFRPIGQPFAWKTRTRLNGLAIDYLNSLIDVLEEPIRLVTFTILVLVIAGSRTYIVVGGPS